MPYPDSNRRIRMVIPIGTDHELMVPVESFEELPSALREATAAVEQYTQGAQWAQTQQGFETLQNTLGIT